jgi:ubiquinone/menaquinone biosynthesis C-methylase UbiE
VASVLSGWERVRQGVCRRSFSSPEALAYEAVIAPAVCRIVAPMVLEHVVAGPVLDVGCGGGRLGAAIGRGVRQDVVGVDSSVAQMHRLARHRRSGVAGVRASAMHLPFAEQRFAAVVSSCAVKHWLDPAIGLAECVRVARVGAPLVVVEIDGGATMEEVQRFAKALPLPFGLREAYARFAMRTVVGIAPRSDELAAALGSAGASEIAAEHVDGLPFVICRGRRL